MKARMRSPYAAALNSQSASVALQLFGLLCSLALDIAEVIVTRIRALVIWTVLAGATGLGAARTCQAQILISSSLGNTADWLIGASPLNISPGETRFDVLQLLNNPFNPGPITGPVQLQVDCCKDSVSRMAVTPNGVSISVCGSETWTLRNQRTFVVPDCTTTTVGVTATTRGEGYLMVEASNAAPPGGFIATINANSTAGRSSKEVFVNVLPVAWPADDPAPVCASGVPVVSLASINPSPLVWKLTNPGNTKYYLGAKFGGANASAGLQVSIVDPGGTAPIPRNIAIVTFKNTKGRPVGMRTVNSANCSVSGQQVRVAQGETKSISINSGNTTTLVFSKSTCRAALDWFDCWGGAGLGLDDIVVFSEGPFWALFGGRKAEIETVGDWGAIPRPDSVATIKTQ
jgi:hypothetical protein